MKNEREKFAALVSVYRNYGISFAKALPNPVDKIHEKSEIISSTYLNYIRKKFFFK